MNPPKKIREYEIKKELGSGAYGIVYKVTKVSSPLNELVLKQISLKNLKKSEIKKIENEAILLKELNSKYIVKYIDSFIENNYLNIIMEFCNQGDLDTLLKSKKQKQRLINENWVWKLFIQISIGLLYLHNKNILHRDLKSPNIFLTGKEKNELIPKIGDLGVSKKLVKEKFAKTFIGTPYYLSPEICEDREYNDKSDVWALGCILFELCTYNHPFEANSQGALILKIMNAEVPNISDMYSESLRNLVKIILNKDDKKRPSVKDILNMSDVVQKAKLYGLFDDVCYAMNSSNIIDDSVIPFNSHDEYISEKKDSKNIIQRGESEKVKKYKNNLIDDEGPINYNKNNNVKNKIERNFSNKEKLNINIKIENFENERKTPKNKPMNHIDNLNVKNNKEINNEIMDYKSSQFFNNLDKIPPIIINEKNEIKYSIGEFLNNN